jgi:outer membrane receptor protein involved in Fe transport
MFKRTKLNIAVGALLGGALAMPVFAQSGERVEITGSRIKSLNGETTSPITTVGEQQLREQQAVAIEEVIRSLPAAVPAIGPGTNNGTGGGATIDLRGLGSNRSLVLVNGRRLVPFDLNAVVDTNSVPIALLRSVDVYTGGGSAVYGADAVAGVVNFMLRKDFRGVEVGTTYGISGEGDAKRMRTDITIGSSLADGKGNVALSIGKTRTDPVRQGLRPFGEISRSSTSGAAQGSFTSVPGYFDSAVFSEGGDGAGGFDSSTWSTFNFNPLNYYQTPLDRLQATALANYTINDHATVYAEMMYTRGNVTSNLAPSGTFFNTFNVPIGNPYLSAAGRAALCAAYTIAAADCVAGSTTEFSVDIGRRFVELGPRINDFRNKTLQTVVGVQGTIAGSWGYDAYISRGEASQNQLLLNWGSSSKVQQALRAVNTTSCIDPSNGCVPLNIFGSAGSITPAMLNFINLSSISTVDIKQDVFAATVNGDVPMLKSPFAKFPVSLAVGVESRKMQADNFADAAGQINGEVLGTGAPSPTVSGTFKLNEAYVEAKLPLLSDVPGARSLDMDFAYRATEFKTTTSNNYGSWKVGANWEPVRGFRFRAAAQKATRAPNVGELFQPVITSLDNLAVDPCEGTRTNAADATTAGTISNLCRLTGVPVARLGSLPPPSAGQANVLTGGNPSLKPEEADTMTVGFVFEPAFLPGLAFSVDYYQIDITKAISAPSVSDVMDQCYSTRFNPGLTLNAACGSVGRGPGGTFNGSSAPGIALTQTNQGAQYTSGVDIKVDYRLRLGSMGTVDIGLDLNNVDKYWFQASPTSVKRDCVGFYSVACGAPNYEQKFSQRAIWSVGNFVVGYNWRYQSAVIEEPGGTNFLPAYASIKAYSYVDLNASWKASKNIKLSLSVNNAFDKSPPEVGNTIGTTSTNSGNTFPQNYDAIGRFVTVGATFSF